MKIVADANIPFISELFGGSHTQILPAEQINAQTVRNADILLVRSVTKVDRNLLDKSSVKFVATSTIGYDHIDVDYLNERKIKFISAPGSNANSVAEYVTAAILEAACKKNIKLEGKAIGIIGAGHTGTKVAQKCKALGMKVILNDPPLKTKTSDEKYRPIEEIFDCDIVTMHVPLTYDGPDKTYHLADDKFFSSLKNHTIFINSSRGAAADTGAIKKNITGGKFSACILDVWENEPDIDTELLRMTDISTPHIAGYSLDGKVAAVRMICEAICSYFDIKMQYDAETFLPEPLQGELKIETGNNNEQEIIRETVKKIYDIGQDDRDLRKISGENEKGAFFSALRKNYPVRREFHNTKIICSQKNIAAKLSGIGFGILK